MWIIQVLSVTPVEQHWYTDIFRSVLWAIGKGILVLLDGFFDVINKIWQYDFFNNEYVTKIFNGAIIVAGSWLVLKVVIELIMNFIVRNEGKETPLSVYRGIVLAIVMMFLIPPLFQFGHDVSKGLTEAVISVSDMSSSSSAEATISSSIVRSMMYTNETESDNLEYFVKNWKTADINDTEGGFVGLGDCYKYSLNFFMLIVLAIITIFLLFFVAIQMAKRVMEIALYKIIGPFCATSLTSQSKTFELWCKSTMGAFLVTVVQFIGIGLLLTLFGSAFNENGTLTGIFLVIGALLFIISTPTLISSLLNQQSGIISGMGDMQSLVAMGHLTGQGLGIASAGVSSALSLGSNVISGGSNIVSGGVSRISNMMNKGKTLTPEQKSIVQESIKQHNPRKAWEQTKDFINQNSKGRYGNSSSTSSMNNGFNNFNNMRFNTMRNQYMNNKDNVSDRKWY